MQQGLFPSNFSPDEVTRKTTHKQKEMAATEEHTSQPSSCCRDLLVNHKINRLTHCAQLLIALHEMHKDVSYVSQSHAEQPPLLP